MQQPAIIRQKKPEYFAALNGWRGVLALVVVIYHTIWMSHPQATAFLDNMPVLIDLFFVISGFVMFNLYDGRVSSLSQAREFLKKRLARIYPVHYVMLMVAVVYAVARVLAHYWGLATLTPGEILPFQPGANETWQSFLSNLTLTQSMGFHNHLSFDMPAWTVSVFFWTYVVFAGMMLWARPVKARHFILIAGLVGLDYWILSRLKPNMDFHYDLGFWRALGGFFTGVLAAWVYRNVREFLKGRGRLMATAIEVLAVGLLLIFEIYFPGKFQFLVAPVAWVCVLVFAADTGGISKLLATRPFRALGRLSYSMYMAHIFISMVFAIIARKAFPYLFGTHWNGNYFGGDLLLVPYVVVVIVFAALLYRFVEVPGGKAMLALRVGNRTKAFFLRFKAGKA